MTFPAYPQYKDSGIESLGEIPSHWDVTRLPYVIFENNAGEVIDKNFWGDGSELLYTCAKQPLLSDFRDFPARKRTGANDLLLTRNGTPYVHLPSEGAIYSNVVQRVSLIPGIDRKFMRSALDVATRDLVGYGVSIASFNYEMWAALRIPLPDYEEQTQIARFLDHETARIDVLIEEQQRLIELLKEKRQAVISHAVTKGLDPTVPMKDSGVEWLGEVPAHWDVLPVWMLFQMGRGRVISHDEIAENSGDYPVYSSQTERDGVMGSIDTYDFEGDYLTWTTDGANAGTVFRRSGKFNCTNVCGTLLPKRKDDDLRYFVDAVGICTAAFIRHDINPKLMNNVMASIKVPVPPLMEQTAIAAYVSAFKDKETVLIQEAFTGISLLQERRSALISAAVTGKIDVRGWQPPASAQAPESAVAEAN